MPGRTSEGVSALVPRVSHTVLVHRLYSVSTMGNGASMSFCASKTDCG